MRHRSVFLLLVAAVEVLYGAGLIAASGHDPARLNWWPASAGRLAGLTLLAWGVIWCATGAVIGGTCWLRRDRWQFVLAALLSAIWACLAVQRWLDIREPGAWAPAVIFGGIAAAITLVSAWPDPAAD
jgi:hypothetical protein